MSFFKILFNKYSILVVLFLPVNETLPQGINQEEIADRYYNEGKKLIETAQYDSAKANFVRALEIFRSEKPQREVCEILNQLGYVDVIGGNLDEAENFIQESLNASKTHFGDTSLVYVEALNNLGLLHSTRSALQKSDSIFNLALDLLSKIDKRNQPVAARTYCWLSLNSVKKRDFNSVLEYANKSIKILEDNNMLETTAMADSYLMLGSGYDGKQQFNEALITYQKALDLRLRLGAGESAEAGKIHINIGNVSRMKGYYRKSGINLERALSITKATKGERDSQTAIVYNSLALLEYDKGDFETVINYLKHGISIFNENLGPTNINTAVLLNNLAASYSNIGEYEKAIETLNKSMELRTTLLGDRSPALIPNFVNMADAYYKMHRMEEAISNYNAAMDIVSISGDKAGLQVVYRGLAEVHAYRKNYHMAFDYYNKSLSAIRSTIGLYHVDIAKIYLDLGNIYTSLKKYDSAFTNFRRATQTLTFGVNSSVFDEKLSIEGVSSIKLYIEALKGQAEVAFQRYKLQPEHQKYLYQAHDALTIISGLLDQARNMFKQEDSRSGLNDLFYPVYARLIETSYELYTKKGKYQYVNEAFTQSEKSKYGLLLDYLTDVSAKNSIGLPDSIVQKEEIMKADIEELQKKIFELRWGNSDSISDIDILDQHLASLKKDYQEFILSLEASFPSYHNLKYHREAAQIVDIQKNLSGDEVVLEYFIGDEHLYLFAIDKEDYQFMRFPNSETLRDAILGLRNTLLNNDYPAFVKGSQYLYASLFEPVESFISQKTKLIIIPDGILSLVPFDILIENDDYNLQTDYLDLSYLLKKYTIRYEFSANLAQSEEESTRRLSKIDVLGFAPSFKNQQQQQMDLLVAYNDTTRGAVHELKGTKAELVAISKLFDGKFNFDDEASEENFKQLAPQYNVLHLGTHAITNDLSPSYSKLLLSKHDRGKEDGILYAYELYNLKINADLVVLSACNTGYGKINQGEGVMSLSRGFAYAGCPNLVTSLWAASDQSSASIIKSFYRGLAQGLPKDEALRAAKLEYLQNADPLSASPYFWGNFIFIGDPSPFHSQKKAWVPWLIAAALVFLISLLVYRVVLRKQKTQ